MDKGADDSLTVSTSLLFFGFICLFFFLSSVRTLSNFVIVCCTIFQIFKLPITTSRTRTASPVTKGSTWKVLSKFNPETGTRNRAGRPKALKALGRILLSATQNCCGFMRALWNPVLCKKDKRANTTSFHFLLNTSISTTRPQNHCPQWCHGSRTRTRSKHPVQHARQTLG